MRPDGLAAQQQYHSQMMRNMQNGNMAMNMKQGNLARTAMANNQNKLVSTTSTTLSYRPTFR